MKTADYNTKHQDDPRWQLILRIANSSQLRSSPRLCELLFYIADCALRDSPEDLTEQQIGIRVFGRQAGFNSSDDSIVRSQARLLRLKIAAYFETEGSSESVIVVIPKGHYLPVFQPAPHRAHQPVHLTEPPNADALTITSTVTADLPAVTSTALATASPHDVIPAKNRTRALVWLALCTAGVLALVFAITSARARLAARTSPVLTLWQPFLTQEPPLVIYSNALFEGDSKTGLRYAAPNAPHDQPLPEHFTDHYTGIGELVSVSELTKLFDAQHATFTLKRSRLVAWDEAKLRNLIFVGAAAENGSLSVLPPDADFTMMSGNGFAGIVNHRPRKDEPQLLTRPEYPLTKDYAIIALLPGVESGHRTFTLSGLTTMGTEAAVEYTCRPDSAAQLLHAIGYTSGEVKPFEAVLEVTLGGGVPLYSRIIMVHTH